MAFKAMDRLFMRQANRLRLLAHAALEVLGVFATVSNGPNQIAVDSSRNLYVTEGFGGKVEKSAKGWGIGLQRYRVTKHEPWMDAAAAL